MMRIGMSTFAEVRITMEYHIDIIERSLTPLGEAIARCARTIEEAGAMGNEDYITNVVDKETELVENLLGTAFVLCQNYITLVVSSVKTLHKCYKKVGGAPLSTTDESKTAIMALGSPLLPQTPYSQVQVIDAFANYFKHREELQHRSRKHRTDQVVQTVRALLATGANQYSTGHFRGAAEMLGNEAYENVKVFANILREWGRGVFERYGEELRESSSL